MDFEIKYGLIAVQIIDNEVDIVHFCGYEEEPGQIEIDHLREELSQDMSFGLTEMMDKIEIIVASKAVVDHYRKIAGKITESDDDSDWDTQTHL